jgi:hypothetical protein
MRPLIIRLDDLEHSAETIVVEEGHDVVGPPDVPHGFTKTGTGEPRVTAIHGAGRFDTEWLSGPDPVWMSKPKERSGSK